MSTQCVDLLAALRREPLTPLEIQQRFGILRAAARVYDLRQAGNNISTEIVEVPARDGRTARVARYAALPESNNLDLFAHGDIAQGRAA
jgi:hypothetical protein